MESLFSGFQTMFIWLLDYTIDVSILICLIFVIRFATRKKLPAWWHYSLWLILLIRMLVPMGFETISNLFYFVPAFKEITLFELSATATNATSMNQVWHLEIEQALLYLWISGVIVFGIFVLMKNLNFWMIIKSRPLLIDQNLLDLLEECKRRMKIHTVLGVVITDRVKCPALFGYIRPRLLLPEGTLEKLNHQELTYVFMHELGHLKRHDIGVSWLLSIMQVIHWFNPLVWFAIYQMRVDQESACDASALSRIRYNQTAEYGQAIIGFLEKFCQNRQLPALAGIMESKSQMKRRIAMITNYKRLTRLTTIVALVSLISIGFISIVLSGCAGVKQSQTEKKTSADQVDVTPKLIGETIPKYPFNAAKDRIEGRVVLRFVVNREGNVREPEVVSAEPEGFFEQAALEAITGYKFEPAKKDGKPVDCIVKMPIIFKLGQEESE